MSNGEATRRRRIGLVGVVGLVAASVLLHAGCGELAPAESDIDSTSFQRSNFEIRAGEKVSHVIEVEAGQTLEFRAEASRDINVLLLAPDGQELGRWERADHLEPQSIEAEVSGGYLFEFDNSYSRVTRKSVTLLHRIIPAGETATAE